MSTQDKLEQVQARYEYWSRNTTANTSCDNCSNIGEQCHGDDQCGGDGE